jgi:hypothetical protein
MVRAIARMANKRAIVLVAPRTAWIPLVDGGGAGSPLPVTDPTVTELHWHCALKIPPTLWQEKVFWVPHFSMHLAFCSSQAVCTWIAAEQRGSWRIESQVKIVRAHRIQQVCHAPGRRRLERSRGAARWQSSPRRYWSGREPLRER